jgi:type IV secretory pathway TrbD component
MRTLKAGVLYFALVFGAGFVLGTIRTLWVVPSLGARAAELAEAPIMVGIAALAARCVVRRMSVPAQLSIRLALGTVALALMLVAEFTLVLWVRGLSIRDYLASRDPVAETAYYAALLLYAAMPSMVARR